MDEFIFKIKDKIIGRNNIIEQLYALIGYPEEPLPQSIFINGHVASGKSLVIESLLTHLNYRFCIVNCIEHSNGKHIFEYILYHLTQCSIDFEFDASSNIKCDNTMEFVHRLKTVSKDDNSPMVIVLDKCDRLAFTNPTLLSTFVTLKELSNYTNVCTILISDIIWDKFRPIQGLLEPIKIHFPQYTKDEIAQILLLYKPNDHDVLLYRNYLNLFLSVYFRSCRDLYELRYMAKVNFPKYVEPIEKKLCKATDVPKLWKNISHVFKSNLELIYLRIFTEDSELGENLSKDMESMVKLVLSFELPYYAKYMLISAYIASHNPVKYDSRLFVKKKEGKTRRKKVLDNKCKSKINLKPHNFTVYRMIAIFCAIVNQNVDLNAQLFEQITTMCRLGLLSEVNQTNLDEPKLRCCVGYDFVRIMSKSVEFELNNYLYEFL